MHAEVDAAEEDVALALDDVVALNEVVEVGPVELETRGGHDLQPVAVGGLVGALGATPVEGYLDSRVCSASRSSSSRFRISACDMPRRAARN